MACIRPFQSFRFVHLCALILTAFTAAGFASSAEASSTQVGSLLSRSGSCTVKRAAETSYAALYEHNPLYAADVVETADSSKGTVLFNEGSQLLLNADTTVSISGGGRSGQLFHLVSGEVFARLRPGAAAATDSAIATVRGTVFDLVADPNGDSHITVTEGVVHFFNEFGAVDVDAGEHSDVIKGHAPTKPVTVGANDLLFEWTLDLDRSFVTREAARLTIGDLHALAMSTQLASSGPAATPAAHRDYGDVLFDQHQYALALAQYQMAPQDPNTAICTGNTLLALDRITDADASFASAGATPAALVGRAWVALRRQQPAAAQALAEQALAAGGVTLAQLPRPLPARTSPPSPEEGKGPISAMADLPREACVPLPPATGGAKSGSYTAAYITVAATAQWRNFARDAQMDVPPNPRLSGDAASQKLRRSPPFFEEGWRVREPGWVSGLLPMPWIASPIPARLPPRQSLCAGLH